MPEITLRQFQHIKRRHPNVIRPRLMFFHRRHTERHVQQACSRAVAETHLYQGFADAFVTAHDGLTLHVRRYGSRHASAHSVVCLPGLARTAADFHPLAAALTADPAKPRLVLALDYRGHGQSQYDRNPNNYTIRVALADLSAIVAALEITSAIFVGTSFGGVLAMMLATLPPTAVAGVILNDCQSALNWAPLSASNACRFTSSPSRGGSESVPAQPSHTRASFSEEGQPAEVTIVGP